MIELDAKSHNISLLRDEPSVDGKWITKCAPLTVLFYSNKTSYLELQEDTQGYMHIAFYKDYSSLKGEFLTQGPWEVVEISGFDSKSLEIYFLSTELGSTQRHLYSYNLKTRRKNLLTPFTALKPSVIPLESWIPLENNEKNGYYQVLFSPKCHYYVLNYKGPDIPWQKVISTRSRMFFKI